MTTKTESDFIDWLSDATIYIGYARYAQFGGYGFVCATKYDESDRLREAVENLNSGDTEALGAEQYIKDCKCWHGHNPDPAKAMQQMIDAMRDYYFYVLNR